MNTIKGLIDKYKLNVYEFATLLNISVSSLKHYSKKEICTFDVSELIKIHNFTNIPYNEILGEKIFTVENINTKIENINKPIETEEYIKELINKVLDERKNTI